MTPAGNCYNVRYQQGFDVYTLRNSGLAVDVVPQLGARISSLKNLRTQREWLWQPPGKLKFFRNPPGSDFSISPLVGMDECLPTIAPCVCRGRALPDHGEVWAAPWKVHGPGWENGLLRTCVHLPISPFVFERTLTLYGNELRFAYQLSNLSRVNEPFLWAMHPLLQLKPDDRLELPSSTRLLLNDVKWIEALDTGMPVGECAKVFAAPLSEGWARIRNHATGDWIEYEWNPAENNTLGVWLSRGGWHGHHHFALEPTNGQPDSLLQAIEQKHCGMLPAAGSVQWQIALRIGCDLTDGSSEKSGIFRLPSKNDCH